MTCIALVAGEASGDQLGASLIEALKKIYPDARFIGIAGPKMQAAGCESFYPMEQLSVMGLAEVLAHLPGLLRMRSQLAQRLQDIRPDAFIGIDAPDFNLGLERRLKSAGIKTVHFVSPSVWAWRQWRVKKIGRSIDLMLTLFPFEPDFYRQHHIAAQYVGHPFADEIPMNPDKQSARQALELSQDKKLVALLPGSRLSEVRRLSGLFLDVARYLYQHEPDVEFVVPLATDKTREYFVTQLDQTDNNLPVSIRPGQSRAVLQACDVVLLASGTAALEALLYKRPMVVCYKLAALTYWILKTFNLLKVSMYSLPNILAGRKIVDEFIQDNATTANIAPALLELLNNSGASETLYATYTDIHKTLRQNAGAQAANAVQRLIEQGTN
jgi:lipid-A-disaccharide synthase